MDNPAYYRYWGKADQDGSHHLLPYHCLDVAAVGQTVLENNSAYTHHFQQLTGLSKTKLIQWFTFLLALHDLGKFADSFQNLKPALLNDLQYRNSPRQYGDLRHDSLGLILWNNSLRKHFQARGLMPTISGSRRRESIDQPIDFWMGAMLGHHGQPAQPRSNRLLNDDFNEAADFPAACEFVNDLSPILLDKGSTFPNCDLKAIQLASWWLSGLAVLCDWLGSNIQFFPYHQKVIPLSEYWMHAKEYANNALQKTELLSGKPSKLIELKDLLTHESDVQPKPTPLQQTVSQWTIHDSPHLFILEDLTGSGKTEAAIMLVHRLMSAGQGNSLYFALPTMATANAIYKRMGHSYRKLFSKDKAPSLVLAHGAREMSKEFKESIVPLANASTETNSDGTLQAEAHCNAWLADNRKKALLADVGVGTIDQALLAILPTRHQSLRLLGLLNTILLIDEVHACDAYMHELLCALLRTHAAAGGSAILLSATLPVNQRQALLNAFASGRQWGNPIIKETDNQAYPLVSYLSAGSLHEQVVATRTSVRREVEVEFISESESIETILGTVISQGQCACWIRNTVKDAIQTYTEIKRRHPDWQVELFHARYAMGDRLAIENRVVNEFGKSSKTETRLSKILIATQVVEQSLDLDFDVMITDLAPIDLILQRAGRLRRHSRDISGNYINGKDQRGCIKLYIHSPPVVDDPATDWYSRFFKNAQKVYSHHGQLWLGARLLVKQGKYRLPEDARFLIEGVYGDDAQADIPDTLFQQSIEAEGSDHADASIARLNILSMELGYSDIATNRWWDESKTPTRLGEESIQVYLAKWENGKLLPWSDEQEQAWQFSAVSMRTFWISAESPTAEISQELIDACKVDLPAKGKWGVLLPLTHILGDEWQGVARNAKNETIQLIYNQKFGLMVNPELRQKDASDESD